MATSYCKPLALCMSREQNNTLPQTRLSLALVAGSTTSKGNIMFSVKRKLYTGLFMTCLLTANFLSSSPTKGVNIEGSDRTQERFRPNPSCGEGW